MKPIMRFQNWFINGFLALAVITISCNQESESCSEREVMDFNFNWQYHHGELLNKATNTKGCKQVQLPHDWSVRMCYQKEKTSASSGFVSGGIGWYQKDFKFEQTDNPKAIRIELDEVYCTGAFLAARS